MFDISEIFSDLDSLQNEEFVSFSRYFVSELKRNNDLIVNLKKFNNPLQGLFSGTIQTKTTKQVFFIKCSNQIKSRVRYDSIIEIFSNIESYKLHYLGETFLKIKAIELKMNFLKNPNLEAETDRQKVIKKIRDDFAAKVKEEEAKTELQKLALEEETEKNTRNIKSNQIISDHKCFCITCGNEYPIERKKLGFNVCIKCSTAKAKTFVDKGFQTREGHKIMSSKGYRNSKKNN